MNTEARIVAVQTRLGFTQAEMAAYLGVPVGTMMNWVKGRREAPPSIARLLDVLGTVEALAPVLHGALMPKRPAP